MLEILGEIVEMGALEGFAENARDIGFVLKTKEGEFITVSGLTVGDIWQMPNALYKQAKITIELPNVKLTGSALLRSPG